MSDDEISPEVTAEVNRRMSIVFENLVEAGFSVDQILTTFEAVANDLLKREVRVVPVPGNLNPPSTLRQFEDGNYGLEFEVVVDSNE